MEIQSPSTSQNSSIRDSNYNDFVIYGASYGLVDVTAIARSKIQNDNYFNEAVNNATWGTYSINTNTNKLDPVLVVIYGYKNIISTYSIALQNGTMIIDLTKYNHNDIKIMKRTETSAAVTVTVGSGTTASTHTTADVNYYYNTGGNDTIDYITPMNSPLLVHDCLTRGISAISITPSGLSKTSRQSKGVVAFTQTGDTNIVRYISLC